MTISQKTTRNENRSALICMLIATVLFSTLPISFSIGGASDTPFLFVSAVKFFEFVICAIALFYFNKSNTNYAVLNTIRRNITHPAIVWATLANFDYVFFAFSLKYIDVAISGILVETWPIFMILTMVSLFDKKRYYKKFTREKWLLSIFGFFGCVFVIASQSGNLESAVDELFTYAAIGGIGLALFAGFLGGIFAPYTIEWGEHVSESSTGQESEQFFAIVATAIVLFLGSMILVVLGLLSGEHIDKIGSAGISIAAVYGILAGIATILFRVANIKTTNLGVNALGYATPAVSLIWLALASLIFLPHIDWLIIGVAAVTVSNLLLNFEASIRPAYKALIIALWMCGAWVYLHTSFAIPDYFISVEIASVLFILLLSFRMGRLVRRTTDEENTTLLLFRKLGTLAQQGKIAASALESLRVVDSYQNSGQLREAYNKIKDALSAARKQAPERAEVLDEVEAELDQLALSKQQGINFGELTALGFIGVMPIITLLFFEPGNLNGWNGFLAEISSAILASAVLFLFFNVLDLQHDRNRPIVEERKKPSAQYSVLFRDAADRKFGRGISVIVCLAITLSYGWLFFVRWL